MKYFKDCKSTEEVKKIYRELAKKFHPDHGGNKEDMVELVRQYSEQIIVNPNGGDKFSDWSHQQKEEMFQKGQKAWREQFKNASYGGYGGYKYNTNSNMRQEYYKQQDDPRLADYERMKNENNNLERELYDSRDTCRILSEEINSLKKKVQTQKRQLDKLKNMPKNAKKPTKKSSKQSSIAL